MRAPTMAVAVALVAMAGCGGSDDDSSKGTASGGGGCAEVTLGKTDQGVIKASVVMPKNVDCATAETVVREWGAQQVGLGNAKLPAGWDCSSSSPPCRKGNASVDLTLNYPQPQ